MKIAVHHRCADFNSYRAARVKSLFNAESGCNFDLAAELPIDDADWKIGLIVGPSGSGKSSIGEQLWPEVKPYAPRWPSDRPIVDAILSSGRFDVVTAALSAAGLGSVPTWLRPYKVLSNGERFRATMARVIAERPQRVKLDEFTSVVDRQAARFGALAFARAWRKTPGQAVLISCHRDVIDWLEPDWIFDTATGKYAGRSLWRRLNFTIELRKTDWSYWPLFEPHHYLKLPKMIASTNYVAFVEDQPVAHIAFSTRPGMVEARAARLVVMPEWQGAGIGLKVLNHLCHRWRTGRNPYRLRLPTLFNTSHPAICASLRRDPRWVQVSAKLYGDNKTRSMTSLLRSNRRNGTRFGSGFGGHFRAVQGFRYLGPLKIARDSRAMRVSPRPLRSPQERPSRYDQSGFEADAKNRAQSNVPAGNAPFPPSV